MNNQQKFKKGDRVKVTYKDTVMYNETCTVEEMSDDDVLIVRDNGQRYWIVSDFLVLVTTSPIPDMLAIPDDYVWPVEWRKMPDNGDGEIFTDGKHFSHISIGATHYLTESDLLKLPFQK